MNGKSKTGKIILSVLLLLAVILMVALPFILESRASNRSGESVRSATAETGQIDVTVSGAGVLSEEDAVSISIPDDVRVTGYLAANGDIVEKGQPVASVDTISVYQVAAELADALAAIRSELSEIQATAVSTSITSNVAGVVTALYAEEGDDIRQVMMEHGALAEITMDNGTVIRVSGTSGTISRAPLQPGYDVFSGAVIYEMIDVDATGEYGLLVLQHQKYEAVLAQLFQMLRDGYVTASESGMISGVDTSFVTKKFTAAHPEPSPLVVLSEASRRTPDGPGENGERSGGPGGNAPRSLPGQGAALSSGFPDEESRAEPDDSAERPVSPKTGEEIETNPADGKAETVTEYLFAQLSSALDNNSCANVKLEDGTVILLAFSDFPNAKKGDYVCIEKETVTTFPEGAEPVTTTSYQVLLVTEISVEASGRGSGSSSGSNSGRGTGGSSGGGSGDAGGSSEGSTVSSSGSAGGSSVQPAETWSLSMKTIASVVPTDSMIISITVDELDILSISRGDRAIVTIDALPGRAFEGLVTGVNTGSSNSGGNSKYLAEITIPREEEFLAGMNASGLITLQTYRDVIVVPSAALSELNGRTVIYTDYNKDTMTLLEPVEVETGVSDGDMVQIISGLEAGESCWYTWYENDAVGVSSKSGIRNPFRNLLGGRGGRR